MDALTWWPAHLPAPEHMHVEMIYRLGAVLAVVDHHAETVVQDPFLSSHLAGHIQKVTQDL